MAASLSSGGGGHGQVRLVRARSDTIERMQDCGQVEPVLIRRVADKSYLGWQAPQEGSIVPRTDTARYGRRLAATPALAHWETKRNASGATEEAAVGLRPRSLGRAMARTSALGAVLLCQVASGLAGD